MLWTFNYFIYSNFTPLECSPQIRTCCWSCYPWFTEGVTWHLKVEAPGAKADIWQILSQLLGLQEGDFGLTQAFQISWENISLGKTNSHTECRLQGKLGNVNFSFLNSKLEEIQMETERTNPCVYQVSGTNSRQFTGAKKWRAFLSLPHSIHDWLVVPSAAKQPLAKLRSSQTLIWATVIVS